MIPIHFLFSSFLVPILDHPQSIPVHPLASSMCPPPRCDIIFLKHSFDRVIPQIKNVNVSLCLKHSNLWPWTSRPFIAWPLAPYLSASDPHPHPHTHRASSTHTHTHSCTYTQTCRKNATQQHIPSHTYTHTNSPSHTPSHTTHHHTPSYTYSHYTYIIPIHHTHAFHTFAGVTFLCGKYSPTPLPSKLLLIFKDLSQNNIHSEFPFPQLACVSLTLLIYFYWSIKL